MGYGIDVHRWVLGAFYFTDEMNNLIAVHDIRPPVCITET
jgi:hypothetical protein